MLIVVLHILYLSSQPSIHLVNTIFLTPPTYDLYKYSIYLARSGVSMWMKNIGIFLDVRPFIL